MTSTTRSVAVGSTYDDRKRHHSEQRGDDQEDERSRKRHHPHQHRHRRGRSLSDDDSSSSSERERRHKTHKKEKREKEKQHKKHKDKKKKKEKKKHKKKDHERRHHDTGTIRKEDLKNDGDPTALGPRESVVLSQDNYYDKNAEFRFWLKSKKNIYFDELDGDSAHQLFDTFCDQWNNRALEGFSFSPCYVRKKTQRTTINLSFSQPCRE